MILTAARPVAAPLDCARMSNVSARGFYFQWFFASLIMVAFLASLFAVSYAAERWSPWAVPTSTPMAAATTVGEICLETHEGNVVVRFRAAQGWSFTETQLAVASALEGIPRAEAGIPIIGRFPRRTVHTPVVKEFTYSIPLAELGVSPDEEVIVAAHASVVNTTGVEEGGWGRGERFTPRGNPATYFRYSITGG